MLPDISVVVLGYRSGNTIKPYTEKIVEALESALPSRWEIILVGNYLEGKEDVTPEIVREMASKDSRIKAVTLVKKGMMGWDARSGLKEAGGETIALVDGDGQIDPKDLIRVYKKLREGFDLVKTYRIKRHDGVKRRIVSFLYNLSFNIVFPGKIFRDINAKPKIISREAYKRLDLTSDDWFLDAEMMLQARRLRLNIAELPAVFYRSEYRPSLVKTGAIFEFIKNMFRSRIKMNRRRFMV